MFFRRDKFKIKVPRVYIQKAGDPGDKTPHFFGFSAKFVAENPEIFKFALCLETALPMFSKLCSKNA